MTRSETSLAEKHEGDALLVDDNHLEIYLKCFTFVAFQNVSVWEINKECSSCIGGMDMSYSKALLLFSHFMYSGKI